MDPGKSKHPRENRIGKGWSLFENLESNRHSMKETVLDGRVAVAAQNGLDGKWEGLLSCRVEAPPILTALLCS